MKVQKGLAVLATLSLLGLSVACSDRYQEGFNAGKDQGYREGYDDGYVDGDLDGYDRAYDAAYAEAKIYFASAGYNEGFNDGKTQGIQIGYSQGYSVGKTDGYSQGYNVGKSDGYSQGYNVGKVDGYNQGKAYGYNLGYDDGYDDGVLDGYDIGYDDGYDDGVLDGYDLGYDDGYYDGYYGLAVGKTSALKGYANILSMAHNDMIDYSKIKAPKETSRGLVANGKLLLEETSLTNKDTLKRAAVVEQYLVAEMASQVKGKFGLSAERSLKVAKAANHFRKFASKRALTAEDTNAYASEIIGADIKTIESAVSKSMKGDAAALQSVIEKAAAKNETSPEKMAEIVSTLFI